MVDLPRNTFRQLKFIIPGAVITYIFDPHRILIGLLSDPGPSHLARTFAFLSLGLGLAVVGLFLSVLIFPWIKGAEPDYRSWRQSRFLSSIIPTLTVTILAGWTLLSITLGRWSSLGYLEGTIGASGLYALAFGSIGLLPSPKLHRS